MKGGVRGFSDESSRCLLVCRASGFGLLFAVSLGISGCRLVGGQGPQGPGVEGPEALSAGPPLGSYLGFLEIEGGRVDGRLTVSDMAGGDFRGSFESTAGLIASGQGRTGGHGFQLELAYAGDCPGTMVLTGRWESATFRITGSVQASDCTGAAAGTFLFELSRAPERAGEPSGG